jgi:hypothetical protein
MPKKTRAYLEIKPKFNKRAAQMLVDFVNTRPVEAGFIAFKKKWNPQGPEWLGSLRDFRIIQQRVRELWERRLDATNHNIAGYLGLLPDKDDEYLIQPPFWVDSANCRIVVLPQYLNELIWLVALQHFRDLGVCENHTKSQDCPSPYFIKYRPNARFCSEACASTAKREAKLRWWNKHRKKKGVAGKKV